MNEFIEDINPEEVMAKTNMAMKDFLEVIEKNDLTDFEAAIASFTTFKFFCALLRRNTKESALDLFEEMYDFAKFHPEIIDYINKNTGD